MTDKILVTSALPYANGPLHFGHIAGAYLPADCYARYQRLKGKDVLYVCGSDEHGVAITLSAEVAGRTPKEHVDFFHKVNQELFRKLSFSFDHYSRTTWQGHVEPAQRYFLDLLDNGYIEEKVTDQLYSEQDERFLADRYVVGTCPTCGFTEARGDECPKCAASFEATQLINPRSKITGSALTLKATKHWFLRLDLFKEQLTEWLEKKDWKPNVVKFVRHYVDNLHPRAITRDSNWGIPVPLPNAEGKVLYVWFDAPIGYISASMEWAQKLGDSDRWKDYWCDPKTKLVHFIGKDNIPFHAVIFPAMTMGQNGSFKLVDELPANEFLNLEGRQFSKSDGWSIDLEDFFERYTSDQIRYTIAANAPESSDSDFTWKDFQGRCNSELVGKWGNLINRVLVFVSKHAGGQVPALEQDLEDEDRLFLQSMKEKVDEIDASYARFRLRRASQLIMELAQLGNGYFDWKQPWKDAKDPTRSARLKTTLSCCLECLKALAITSFPIIPDAASKLWQLLGIQDRIEEAHWDRFKQGLQPGTSLPKPEILFQKIETEQIEKEIEALKGMKQDTDAKGSYAPIKDPIGIDTVDKLDLRVGKVISSEKVPKSKKLLKLGVDIGLEVRTVVAGLGGSYTPSDLLGKKVVIVANLKPAKLMGVTSEGMLLAGADVESQSMEVATLGEVEVGSVVR